MPGRNPRRNTTEAKPKHRVRRGRASSARSPKQRQRAKYERRRQQRDDLLHPTVTSKVSAANGLYSKATAAEREAYDQMAYENHIQELESLLEAYNGAPVPHGCGASVLREALRESNTGHGVLTMKDAVKRMSVVVQAMRNANEDGVQMPDQAGSEHRGEHV